MNRHNRIIALEQPADEAVEYSRKGVCHARIQKFFQRGSNFFYLVD